MQTQPQRNEQILQKTQRTQGRWDCCTLPWPSHDDPHLCSHSCSRRHFRAACLTSTGNTRYRNTLYNSRIGFTVGPACVHSGSTRPPHRGLASQLLHCATNPTTKPKDVLMYVRQRLIMSSTVVLVHLLTTLTVAQPHAPNSCRYSRAWEKDSAVAG